MDSETWLEKAARLQRALARSAERRDIADERAAAERIKIALWLRQEFDDQPAPGSNVIAFEMQD